MTQEEKARAYDVLLTKAKQIYNKENDVLIIHTIEDLFPELNGDEDERIRKALIDFFSKGAENGEQTNGVCDKDILAWLEKQGYKPKGKSTLEAIKEEKVDNQNCVKSVYNDEPKFKVGDWVVFTNGNVEHIVSVGTHGYTFDDGDYLLHDECDKIAHLWTIKDAEDGDVLVFKNNIGGIIICKSPSDYDTRSYCRLISDNFINKEESGWDSTLLVPATKEQRDTLFAKMKEAGYAFNFEEKELKKLGQPEVTKTSDQEEIAEIPFGAKDSELQEATYYIPKGFHAEIDNDKVVIKKSEKTIDWGEEDERMILSVEQVMNCASLLNIVPEKVNKIKSWLKSFRPRFTWKPSKEQMEALNNLNLTGDISYVGQGQILIELYKDLKKLIE